MFYSLIPLLLSAICCSVMDICVHKFKVSIFSKIKNGFWYQWFDGGDSWKNKYVDRIPKNGFVKMKILGIIFNKPVQLSDSWHFFKMLFVCFFILSTILEGYFMYNCFRPVDNQFLYFSVKYTIYGVLWNIVFSVFYRHILKLRS